MAEVFIQKYNTEFSKNIRSISPLLEQRLLQNPWEGNTRELEHVIRNMMLRAHELDTELTVDGFPDYLSPAAPTPEETPDEAVCNLNEALDRMQERLIRTALKRSSGNLTQAARELGIQRQSLAQRMKRLGITASS